MHFLFPFHFFFPYSKGLSFQHKTVVIQPSRVPLLYPKQIRTMPARVYAVLLVLDASSTTPHIPPPWPPPRTPSSCYFLVLFHTKLRIR